MKTTILRTTTLLIIAACVLLMTSIAAIRFDIPGSSDYSANDGHVFMYIAALVWVGLTGWIMATHRRYRIRARA